MEALLERSPILRSRDIEEARAFLSTRAIRLDLPGPAGERAGFDVHYNGIYLPGLWLGYIRYGVTVIARVHPSRGDYWVHFPMHGRIEIRRGWDAESFDPQHAAVTSPFEVCVLKSSPDSARLSLAIQGDALTRHLAALLDDTPRNLAFASTIDLQDGFGRSFARLLQAVARELCESDMLSNPLVASDFEQLVMTNLLVSHPHNYSDALRRREVRVAPRDVRRAMEFIRAHAAEPITLGDLVRASGVAGRTLLKHFRDLHGVSPMRYVRNHRLHCAREQLLGPDPGTVSEIALRWGFAHLGRFAIEYRKRFGESPSATRARGQ